MSPNTKERVFDLVSQVFQISISKVTDDLSPDDVEMWDSIQHLNLIVELEKEFSTKFSIIEMLEIEDIGSILKILETKKII